MQKMVVLGPKNKILALLFGLFFLFIFSCKDEKSSKDNKQSPEKSTVKEKITVPDFNQDSAFNYVKKQTDFGPRVPNTEAHKECGDYLVRFMRNNGAEVIEQRFKVRAYNNDIINGRNIISSYNINAKKRILLCAHWDSRPYADWDSDSKNHYKPIDGANDGASGVGVLMEIARQFNNSESKIGLDIIFFDAEDYGEHKNERDPSIQDAWALGSQYWSKNPHIPNYKASYGILLDMVGAKNARFTKEHYSMYYAKHIVEAVWNTANKLGYSYYFVNKEEGNIVDDHYYVNKLLGIPTIDIIHTEPSRTGFFKHWHTVDDNIDNIDPFTLKVVGETVLTHIFHNN